MPLPALCRAKFGMNAGKETRQRYFSIAGILYPDITTLEGGSDSVEVRHCSRELNIVCAYRLNRDELDLCLHF